jgi:hypothetical protein
MVATTDPLVRPLVAFDLVLTRLRIIWVHLCACRHGQRVPKGESGPKTRPKSARSELGEHDEVVAEAEAAELEHPLREGLWAKLPAQSCLLGAERQQRSGALPSCSAAGAVPPCVESIRTVPAGSGLQVTKVLMIPPGDPKVGAL